MFTSLFAATVIGTGALEARSVIDAAFAAMGGRVALASIQSTHEEIAAHGYAVEQSERPEGPFLVNYVRSKTEVSFDQLSITEDQRLVGIMFGGEQSFRSTAKPWEFASPGFTSRSGAQDRILFGPERLLFVAERGDGLRLEPPVRHQGVEHQVLSFRWGRIPVKVYFNASTHLPSLVRTRQTRDGFNSMWGDVEIVTHWSLWDLLPGGLRFPRQWTQEIGGVTVGDRTILQVEFKSRQGSEPVLPKPPELAEPDAQAIASRYRQTRVAEGVTLWEGPFNMVAVRQGDGLLILEPVLSSGFQEAMIGKIEDSVGAKVIGVLATDDAWPHFGGLRAYAARGVPIYTLDLNRPIADRLLKSRYESLPDRFARSPRRPRFVDFSEPKAIGTGPNRAVAIPIRGEGSERMVMVYFPEQKLLYGSDLLQRMPNGSFFFPAYADELVQAVSRHQLKVERVFGMHLSPTPWNEIVAAVDQIRGGSPRERRGR